MSERCGGSAPLGRISRRDRTATGVAGGFNREHDMNKHSSPYRAGRPGVAAVAALIALAGCATTPPPTASLQAAERAIASAEQARVTDFAANELGEARDKLNAARDAVRQEDMGRAYRLAEQSRAAAELASARAALARARAVNADMSRSTDTLKQEMQRNTGDR